MRFRRSFEEEPEVNLIPLIDVLLIVLIFLAVSTTYSRFAELKIQLPTADATLPAEPPRVLNVAVTADGRYALERTAAAALDLERTVTTAWQRRGLLAWLLSPVALLFACALGLRRAAYSIGLVRVHRVGVPVIVIGNLYAGGTGKTPLTIELVNALKRRGWRPAVVSRGYGTAARTTRLIGRTDSAQVSGDEPLLIAQATGVPVAVGRARADAARRLLTAHPDRDVIVADDGLQHWRLGRDLEIALLDERGLGNGWLLPAGPLRETARRLARVNAIVLRDGGRPPAEGPPCFMMRTRLADAIRRLDDPAHTMALAELAKRQSAESLTITAAAGIAVPERFFALLQAAGISFEPLPLPDHHDFRDNPLSELRTQLVLITEKDAVKCSGIATLRRDPRIWVVPLVSTVDEALFELVEARLGPLRKTLHGSPTA
jgi:tetraacyldisaccharide 4'-kinase